MKPVSVIIRGPLYECSIDNIENYLKSFNVIVSHWEDGQGDDFELKSHTWENNSWTYSSYEPIIALELRNKILKFKNIKTIENKYEDIRFDINFKFHDAIRNIYQFHSTYEGLRMCDTEYAICIRSDIPYPNLEPIQKKIEQFPDKIITSNTNFRPDNVRKYHMGSHVVAGKTKTLLDMYDLCLKLTKNKNNEMNDLINKISSIINIGDLVGEQVMAFSILTNKNEVFTKENSKSLMKKYFDVVPIHELGGKYRKYNNKNGKYDESKGIINNINEL